MATREQKIAQAKKLRKFIETNATLLTDEDALELPNAFPEWNPTATYKTGDRVRYNGKLYKCLQDHTAQADWTPEAAVSLWALVINEGIPEWQQPESTNPYMKGDKVKHNGKTWESTIDNNVWEPGVYGWDVIS